MILVSPGIVATDDQGSDRFVLYLFNGQVPVDENALGIKAKSYWDLIDTSFCGSVELAPTIFAGKHTRNDNIRFARKTGVNVPFEGHTLDNAGSEGNYRLYPIQSTYSGSDEYLGSSADPRMGIQHCLNAATEGYARNNYMDLGSNSVAGDYVELSYPYKHVAKNLRAAPYDFNSSDYSLNLELLGYDYDLDDWVLVLDLDGSTSDKLHDLSGNTLSTDKYRLVITSMPSDRPIFSKFFMYTDTDPTHTVEQPTWAVLMNINEGKLDRSKTEGLPFIMASCTGPTGGGELIIHNDNLEIGEYANLMSNEITFGSIWEEAL